MPADDMYVFRSALPPKQVIERFKQTVETMGMKIFSVINFAADAASVELNLEETILLIFGNPKVGTLLLQEKPTVGIDLPLKAIAWTKDGQHWFAYNRLEYIVRRHGIHQEGVVEKIKIALQTAAGVALGNPSKPNSADKEEVSP